LPISFYFLKLLVKLLFSKVLCNNNCYRKERVLVISLYGNVLDLGPYSQCSVCRKRPGSSSPGNDINFGIDVKKKFGKGFPFGLEHGCNCSICHILVSSRLVKFMRT